MVELHTPANFCHHSASHIYGSDKTLPAANTAQNINPIIEQIM